MGNIFTIQCGDALAGRCWDCLAKKSHYVSNLGDNLDALKAATDRLEELRNDVIRNVINQQRPHTEQPDQVSGWLLTADDTVDQVTELLTRGEQEKQHLCMSGYCSKHYISTYRFGKSVARSLNRVNALIETEFKELVVNAPAKQLESNLEELRNVKLELQALKEDLQLKISLEKGPEKRTLKQVQVWISKAGTLLAGADILIVDGPQELDRLLAGDISNSVFVGRVSQQIEDIRCLHSKGDFSQVVMDTPAKQLESHLLDLKDAKVDLQALKEDIQQRISLEEGPQKRALKQVQVWLSRAETLLAEADNLIEDGVQELNKLFRGDISNSEFVQRVSKQLEDVRLLHSQGHFSEVTAKAVPRRVVQRYDKPTVGTEEMLEEAWSVLHKAEVGIIGIYGMGGVGKTTLLTRINNKFAGAPNGFDVVIWVVVSKDLKVDNIQETIWKQIQSVDDRWLQKSFQEKAEDICHVLQGKQFLLLLDDVWKRIDLEEIGVPLPTKRNGSKIVLTTRSFAVCKQMEATQTMKVKPLNKVEAWQLFKEKVGEIDADVLHVARMVAEECRGLPIALITIGRAMASRSTLEEWEHALKVLRRSVSNLQGMKDELYQDMEVCVFKRLKFSYDSLPNNTLQSCFLYCALFPEDFKILKHDLVRYWVAENYCGRHEGYGIVYTLIRQCLIEEEGEYVKLHDVVRDTAVWIACECEKENYKFFTQAGAQLFQLPKVKEWERAEKVSFMANSLKSIEGSPRCWDLVTLFLSHNAELKIISQGFFQYMTRLTVLDLSHTEIKVLPLEILNLQSLEFLNLSHTKLEKLPIEMKRLTMLKYLNLEGTFCLEMIPVQVISHLSELQVLNMFQCGSPLYEKVENNVLSDGNMLISELMCLEKLGELSMTVRSASFLQSICSNQKLLNCMNALHLSVIKGTKSLNISSLSNAKQLNLLDIVTNFDLEELVIKDRETQAPGSSLNNNMLIFCGLREVNVDANYNIRHMTWLIFAPHLTILRARRNDNMEEIISSRKLGEHQARVEHLNLFAKLQVLDLYDLQKLKSIFPIPLSFPCLTQIDVRRCPALKKLPLNSKSAEGCNVVIKAGESWWNKLTWEDDETEAAFSSCFQKI